MQHRRRIGVGMTDLDRKERGTIEVETALIDDDYVHIAGGKLPRNTRSQNSARNFRSFCTSMSLAVPSVARTVTPVNLCGKGIAPNQWSPCLWVMLCRRRHQRADQFQLGRPPPNRGSDQPLADMK
jgi:hypothetical protein